MRTFYFVGGPSKEQREAFFHTLTEIGGSPAGWRVFPHASGDGRALHVVEATDERQILAHLASFGPIYPRGPIVEVLPLSKVPEE